MGLAEWGVFLVASAALAYLSRASLRALRSHGFYRFWAWECLLPLLLLNLRRWFADPFAWHQLISWLLLLASLFLVIEGARLLRRGGRSSQRADAPLLAWEKTAILVTEGAYRYIRHPLYGSLLFLGWGIFFKAPSWLGGVLVGTASVFLALTARAEERENLRFFGPGYREYMKRTKMFVPFLF